MNLIDIYPCTNQRLYFFQSVKNQQINCYNVAIYKWSESQKKHIFEDHLSPQSYIEMLGEPDMVFDSLFDNDSNQNRNILDVLHKNKIKMQDNQIERYYYDTYRNESIQFLNKHEADMCVRLLQQIFKYASP